MSPFDPNPTSARCEGFHSEGKVIAIRVDNVKVTHAIVAFLWCFDHVGSARDQIGVHKIDILHEYTDAAITGQALGLVRREQVQSNFVTAQARVECWVSIFKSDREAERVAVMLDALSYVADDKYGSGPYHHWMFLSHRDRKS